MALCSWAGQLGSRKLDRMDHDSNNGTLQLYRATWQQETEQNGPEGAIWKALLVTTPHNQSGVEGEQIV